MRDARTTQNRALRRLRRAIRRSTPTTPYLVWAETLAAPGGAGGKDLRYEQKMLGRNGVAGLTSIGSADQMPAIAAAAADLRGMLSFPEGQRHADFQPASDQVSAYSVPGLVTGVPTAQPQAVADAASTGGTGQTAFGGLSGYFPWIALGVVVLAGAGYHAHAPPREMTTKKRPKRADTTPSRTTMAMRSKRVAIARPAGAGAVFEREARAVRAADHVAAFLHDDAPVRALQRIAGVRAFVAEAAMRSPRRVRMIDANGASPSSGVTTMAHGSASASSRASTRPRREASHASPP